MRSNVWNMIVGSKILSHRRAVYSVNINAEYCWSKLSKTLLLVQVTAKKL